jgi:predicted DNA-binding transcriptional regulator YafY
MTEDEVKAILSRLRVLANSSSGLAKSAAALASSSADARAKKDGFNNITTQQNAVIVEAMAGFDRMNAIFRARRG